MAQERIDDWWEYAKDLAKAERELQIERWVYISIKYKDEAGRKCRLPFISLEYLQYTSILLQTILNVLVLRNPNHLMIAN